MRKYNKQIIVIILFLVIAGIGAVRCVTDESIFSDTVGRNLIFEGTINERPVRVRMYHADHAIYADMVSLGETDELALNGRYNPVFKTITLKNKEKDIVIKLHNQNMNDYVGSIRQKKQKKDMILEAYGASPVTGEKDRTHMYDSMGYDTQILDLEVNRAITSIKNDDRETVADMASYPLIVNTNDGKLIVEDKADFLQNYEKIINETIKTCAQNEFSAFWNVGYEGLGIFYGRVWLVSSDEKIMITAIDNHTY